MASIRLRILPPGSGVPQQVESETLDLDLNSVLIGTSKLAIIEDSGRLSTGTIHLKVPDATAADEPATYQQLVDAVESGVDSLTASEGLVRVVDDFQIAEDGVTKDKVASDVAGAGLAQNVDGSLEVNEGEGLWIDIDVLKVLADSTGGAGLATAINVSADGVAVLVDDASIEAGVGQIQIKADGVTKTHINEDVAGNGLGQNLDGSLEVKVGAGLEIDTDVVKAKADALGGATLATAVNVSANGLAILVDDSSIEAGVGQIQVKADGITKDHINENIAGNGLGQNLDGSLEVKVGDGLEIDTDVVKVKVDALGGANLAKAVSTSANGVAILVDGTSIEGDATTGQLKIVDGGVSSAKIAEAAVLGTKIEANIRARLGITGDTTYQSYSSVGIISSGHTYPEALSAIDAALQILAGEQPVEEVQVVGPGGTTTITATTMTWNASNDLADIIVRVNGKVQTQSTSLYPNKDYSKSSTTGLTFSYTLPEGAEVVIRRERVFTSFSGGGGGTIVIKKDGSLVHAGASTLNFIGDFAVTDAGAGQANIENTASGGGGGTQLSLKKRYKNLTGVAIPALSVVAFDDDGSLILADANVAAASDIAGIAVAEIAHNAFGEVYKLGEVPAVLTGLGASHGQFVYLGETPGQVSLTAPGGVGDAIIVLGLAEIADFVEPGAGATSLYLNPEYLSGP